MLTRSEGGRSSQRGIGVKEGIAQVVTWDLAPQVAAAWLGAAGKLGRLLNSLASAPPPQLPLLLVRRCAPSAPCAAAARASATASTPSGGHRCLASSHAGAASLASKLGSLASTEPPALCPMPPPSIPVGGRSRRALSSTAPTPAAPSAASATDIRAAVIEKKTPPTLAAP